ncbi:MAG TPA: M23 family metallopeptidase [Exilispira sp.]|mgnify:FL=1|nr:M23 family metallopeptidase [Exilispira sp.]
MGLYFQGNSFDGKYKWKSRKRSFKTSHPGRLGEFNQGNILNSRTNCNSINNLNQGIHINNKIRHKINLKRSFKLNNEAFISIIIIVAVISSIFLVSYLLNNIALGKNNEQIIALPYDRTFNPSVETTLSTKEISNIYKSVGGEETNIIPVSYTDYKVQVGDNLWTISKKFEISVDSIYSANISTLKNPHILSAGMTLRIPSNIGIVVKAKNSQDLKKIIDQYDVDELSLFIANQVANFDELASKDEIFLPNVELPQTEKLKAYGIAFGYPAKGYISSRMGYRKDPFTGQRRFHSGLDISNVMGTPIYAAYDGVVVFVGPNGGYGNCVIISHPLGYSTLYGHLSKILVKVGQRVSKGSKIALMGSTGRSTGSHLHFEIRKFGKILNPLSYMVWK